MATLLLRLAALLQAWGSSSKFKIRSTEREPTKSGVIGMIAAAMGIQREDPDSLEPLKRLRFGVRVDREGRLLRDYHTVLTAKGTEVTERYYLSDAVFLAALESDDKVLLERIKEALQHPVYPLFLGRRSCPPTLPLVVGIREEALLPALKHASFLSEPKGAGLRIVCDSAAGGILVSDVPDSFSQLHRRYAYRYKQESMLLVTEHDPMAEL